jgi:hypothetical protein
MIPKRMGKLKKILQAQIIFLLLAGCNSVVTEENSAVETKSKKLIPPPDGKIYHAAFPGIGAPEDDVTIKKISDFENLAGKKIAWVYFSNNWFNGEIEFPKENVELINSYGSVPFIRLMPRTSYSQQTTDPNFTMQKIIDGEYDDELIQWAKDARDTNIPLLAEFGTECNGNWFPWNALYNGANEKKNYGDPNLYDGMERFRDAYRHIINITKLYGAKNITWFFHVNAGADPVADWNVMRGYYPGDEYIDWIGLSVYGQQLPGDAKKTFLQTLDECWNEVSKISSVGKPVAILEWGVIDYPTANDKAKWIKEAFNSIKPGGKYFPKIKAMSCWHSSFGKTDLKIDSSAEALTAYRECVSDSIFLSESFFITN